jgi:hypothetical protein
MRLPRVRLSVRNLMLLVAIVALFVAGARHLIMGGGGVTIELANGLSDRIRDIRIGCRGESIVVDELAPGGIIRGRLWPAKFEPGGSLDGVFEVSFTLEGRLCRVKPSHTFDLLNSEPGVRWNVVNVSEPEAFFVTDVVAPRISPWKRSLRWLWFRGALPGPLH